ncbi:MAG TPA: PTS sugar transporter subunit IIB [Candidatus Agathobaculum merdavium]|nr:PTS sugar transporter subunit IIB [Candidatus Agathobaculum merdavium]
MSEIKALLCCGAGFSSGFLAQKTRKAAKKRKVDVSVEAKSESVVTESLGQFDVLLIGPHYESALNRLTEQCAPFGAKVALIPADIYAALDGDKLLDVILDLVGQES